MIEDSCSGFCYCYTPVGFKFRSLAVGAHPIPFIKIIQSSIIIKFFIIIIILSLMNQSPYGQVPSNDDSDHFDSYARLNDQYGPISKDIRNSYGDEYAADLNPLIEQKESKHIRSLIASFIFVVGEITILSLYFTDVIQLQIGQLIGICVGIYVFYLLLGLCCNPLISYLRNIQHGVNLENEYNNIRSIIGFFKFHVQCYHYETRYHTRTVRDSDGNTRTQTYTTQEKVVTHTATEELRPAHTMDDSGSVDQVRAITDIIFVHNIVNYKFKDERSRYIFNREWQSFRMRHRRDLHQDYSYNYILPGLKERMTFYIGEAPKNYLCFLIVFSFIGFLWPYSMFVESKVSRFNINFMKILSF